MSLIPPHLKQNLLNYKYNGVDKSLLSRYVLGPYWNWLVSLFPPTVAPNWITLMGLFCIFFNFALQLYYDPKWESVAPNWVYISYGIGLWIYASFDAIDGKQARRTGTSGPLGELFDHSCDAINTVFVALLTASAAHMGMSWLTASSILVALTNFFLSTWEQYHTGTLYLSHFSGPVEGICMMVIFFLVTGFTGPQLWAKGFKSGLGLSHPILETVPDIPLNALVSYLSWVIMAYNVFTSIYNVVSFCSKNNKSVFEALSGLVPFSAAALSTYFWLKASPFLISKHFIIFMLFIGASFAYTLLFLILSHVIKAPFKYFNRMFIPLFFGCLQSNCDQWFGIARPLGEEQESFFVLLCFAWSMATYLMAAFSIIDEICKYLDIWCLTIKPKQKKTE